MVRYDKFYWWIAQDDRIQSVGEYTYGQNLNIRRWKWIELSKKIELISDDTVFANDSLTTIHYQVWDDTKIWAGTAGGNIIKSTDWGESWTTIFTWSDNNPNIAMCEMSWALYWWQEWKMYVAPDFPNIVTWTLGSTVTEVNLTYTASKQVILVANDVIFFTNGRRIGKVVSSSPTTVSQVWQVFGESLTLWQNIIWITLHANSLWTYTEDGKIYIIDNQSEDVIWFKELREKIIAVRNLWWYDFVVTTAWEWLYNRSFYANTGISPESTQLIRRTAYSDTISEVLALGGFKFTFERFSEGIDNLFAESNGKTYFVGNDWGDGNVIYSQGKNNNIFPDSIEISYNQYRDYDAHDWGDIKCIWEFNWYLYISGYRSTNGYIARVKLFESSTNNLYKDQGFIITKLDDFGEYEKPKIIKQVMVWAEIPAWTSIQLDYSINEWPFVTYKTITNTDAIWTNWKKFEFSTPIEMFNEISWKIKLMTNDETLTPKLYSLNHLVETEIYDLSQ